MEYAENFAVPVEAAMGAAFPRRTEFNELFYLRWGEIRFEVAWGAGVNLKVVLHVYRPNNVVERFIIDTDPFAIEWNRHKRITRDFYLHPFPSTLGRIDCAKFSYVAHFRESSIPSQHEYIFVDWNHFCDDRPQRRPVTREWSTPNTYRTLEMDAATLQRDVDWYNRHPETLNIIPKFTKGQPLHPFHPKRYIHDQIDRVIGTQQKGTSGRQVIKVCASCIDDTDFVSHLIHASQRGVLVQCAVDWRKMTLTNSQNYARLKRANIELLGVFCTAKDPLIEVAPDMHNKFIVFGQEDCIVGSFNISFDRWWANWESGMTFHSRGICRLLDNVFQSIRGGVIQPYGIDPYSPFNLLYTYGRHRILNGKYYRPHNAIISEIHRARKSIRICMFLIGEMRGEHYDSIIDALIQAKRRNVDVQAILNGHVSRVGDPGQARTMDTELKRPLLPAVTRLRNADVSVSLAYGANDHPVPYCPLHSKYCVIDESVVLDGSMNWYNTSVFSHDLLVVAANPEVARPYLYEYNQVLQSFRIF